MSAAGAGGAGGRLWEPCEDRRCSEDGAGVAMGLGRLGADREELRPPSPPSRADADDRGGVWGRLPSSSLPRSSSKGFWVRTKVS